MECEITLTYIAIYHKNGALINLLLSHSYTTKHEIKGKTKNFI